jgi:branched-chain amino acid transport system ATP-binding protein
MNMNILEVESIRAGYGKKEVLKGVSAFAQKGEIVGLIGPNGAGKSTLLKVIAGTLGSQEGRIRLNGQDLYSLAPHKRANLGLGYFKQGGKVFPDLSVEENIELGAFGIHPKLVAEKKVEMLKLFPNIKDLLKRRAGLLSGGERQALALSIILVRGPEVVLLDEPSAGLSPNLVKDMMNKLKLVNTLRGTTILVVEQNVREILKIAKRIYVLQDGVVVGFYSPAELLLGETLEKLYFGIPRKIDAEV